MEAIQDRGTADKRPFLLPNMSNKGATQGRKVIEKIMD